MLNLAKRVNHWVWDPNEERKRLESWQQEQERLLQVHWWNVYVHGFKNVPPPEVLDMCICMCMCLGMFYMCVCVQIACNVYYMIYTGAISERTGEAEERVGESTTGGGGRGEET